MKGPALYAAAAAGLFAAGAGGAWFLLERSRSAEPAAEAASRQEPPQHGRSVAIPENPVLCETHGIPQVVCPFCDPGLIDELGHCGGHDVPEALCTRCNPVLIAAFKVEGDWCAEHGLPESQCLVCRGGAGG